MSLSHIFMLFTLLGIAFWIGLRVPLSGWRKKSVIGLRLIVLAALGIALWAAPFQRTHEVARSIVYLADVSASIDAGQRNWIARRISSLEAHRKPSMPRCVVAFGRTAQVVVPFGNDPLNDPEALEQELNNAKVDPSGTNLEAALLSTLSLVPHNHRAGIVLLSDGRNTDGDVSSILSAMPRSGLSVFTQAPEGVKGSRTVWQDVAVPPVVQVGSPVGIQLVISRAAARPTTAYVTLSLAGVPIKRERRVLEPGWKIVTTSLPAVQPGSMAIDVQLLIPEEGIQERRRVYTEVEGPPRILFVDAKPSALPFVAQALKRREFDVSLVRPDDLPTDTLSLLNYDAVVLFRVPKSSLSLEQTAALRSYLESFGGGLVMIGLGGVLADEIISPAPLDQLLPVKYEAKGLQESKRRVSMIMLIDRSASMLGARIAATKRAAVRLVKQLAPEDLVGILAFDTRPYVVVEVQPAGQVGRELVDKLVSLKSSGGTNVYPALKAAKQRLDYTDARVKHIILLSDGNTPFRRDLYRQLADEFRRDKVSVSTIGIGSVFVNEKYLQWVSSSTGGIFYQLRHLDELPTIVARDAQNSLGRLPFTEGYFRPKRSATSPWFNDIPAWPILRGYLTTTAKPGAQVDLRVSAGETQDPLLARWMIGQGRVAAFTSDADTRWSPEWVRWPRFGSWWAHVMRWVMRRRLTEEIFVWVEERGDAPQIVLEGALEQPNAELIAPGGSNTIALSLVRTGAWRWQASLEQVPSGWYELAIESQKESASIFTKRWVKVGEPQTKEELAGQAPNISFLRRIAERTYGGFDIPDAALVPASTPVKTNESALTWWLPFAILLLLGEIALRGSSML